MNRTLTATLAVAVSLLVARTATADNKSWAAVKKVVGKKDAIIVSFDVSKLRSTGTFQAGLQLVISEEDEAQQLLDTIKSGCGFDLTAVISDATFVMQHDGEDPLIAIGLDGIDEAKAVACIGTLAGQAVGVPDVKLVGKKIGRLTEYSIKGEKEKLYAAWLTKDVLVFTKDVNDRKGLEKRLAGKGATGDLAKYLGRTATGAAIWFAVAEKEREHDRTILGGYGKLELAAGVWKGGGAMVMAKASEATSLATEARGELEEAKKEYGPKAPELARAMGSITVNAVGAEVQINGSVSDKDAATLLPQLDKLF